MEEQQRRVARLYVTGSILEDILQLQSKALKLQRMRLESERTTLEASAQKGIDLAQLAESLQEASARLRQWVLDASDQDMELILRALDIKVRASNKEIQIEGTVPISLPKDEDLLTTVQTSGCSFLDAKTNEREFAWVINGEL